MNYLCIALLLVVPIIGPGSFVLILSMVAALTAYEGLRRDIVYGIVAALVGIELLYGLDVGILSLSYIAVVMMLILARRFMMIAPWTSVSGWRLSDAIRILMIALAIGSVMAVCSVMVGHYVYEYAQVLTRLRILLLPQSIAGMSIMTAVMLVILRRIDEPFRRHIIFGT